MKILKVYNSLLTEAHVESCVSAFGRELFGQEFGGKEKDTKIEKSYAKLIGDFSSENYGRSTNTKFISAIQTLKGCMTQYKEVLLPEKTTVYRGITIPIGYFFEHNQPIITKQPFKYIYKASNPIQSWSTDSDVASIFGHNMEVNELGELFMNGGYSKSPEKVKEFIELVKANHSTTRVAVVFQHQTNKDDYLFKSKYFRLLSNNTHEEEMLRISNKPIEVLAKFNDHTDVFITHDGMFMLQMISRFM